MKKRTIFAIASALLLNTGLYAEDFNVPEKIKLGAYYNNEEITATKQVEGEKTSYTFTGTNGFSATTQNGININALQLMLGITANSESVFQRLKNDSTWHKVVSHYNSGTNDDYTVTQIVNEDTSIAYITSVKDPGFCSLKQIRTKDVNLLKAITGSQQIIGMDRTEVGKYFGSTHEYSYIVDYSFKVLSNNNEYAYLTLGFNDEGKVKEVSLRRCPEERLKITSYMPISDSYYNKIPEGWYSMGKMNGTGVNIRKEPKTGEIIGNTGWKHPEVYFNETRDTGEEFKWLKIRAKVIDENTKEYKGVEGWVYGRYVSPSDKTFSLCDSVYASIAVIQEMPYFLGFDNAKVTTKQEEGINDEGDKYTYSSQILSWPEGLSCNYGSTDPSLINAKPSEEMERKPIEFTITSDKIPFLDIKVGMSLEDVKKFNETMTKAGWGNNYNDSDYPTDGTVFWNCDMQQISANIKDGKVISISHEYLPAY